jgi:nucleoside-diphosphate-sugar epimerase
MGPMTKAPAEIGAGVLRLPRACSAKMHHRSRRDFIPVADVARGLVDARRRFDLPTRLPRIRNLVRGQPDSLREFAEVGWQGFGMRGGLQIGASASRRDELERHGPQI